MLDVLANANRRIKHNTPGLSTMNTLPGFFRREISNFSRRICLSFAKRDFFFLRKLAKITRNEIVEFFRGHAFFLFLFYLDIDVVKREALGHSDKVWSQVYSEISAARHPHHTILPCSAYRAYVCVRYSIRFTLSRDDLVLDGSSNFASRSIPREGLRKIQLSDRIIYRIIYRMSRTRY